MRLAPVIRQMIHYFPDIPCQPASSRLLKTTNILYIFKKPAEAGSTKGGGVPYDVTPLKQGANLIRKIHVSENHMGFLTAILPLVSAGGVQYLSPPDEEIMKSFPFSMVTPDP
jgi:hypothetical protein